MLGRAFDLSNESAKRYRDIPAEEWYAPFAGLAERFLLFPEDANLFELHPTKSVTFHETVLAARAILASRLPDTIPTDLLTRIVWLNGFRLYVVFADEKILYVDEPADQAELPSPDTLNPSTATLRTDVLALVNSARIKAGSKALRYDARMEQSAQTYVIDMEAKRFFSHVSPSGETVRDRFIASGYYQRTYLPACECIKGFAIGENLARNQRSARQVFEDWMKSPKHRAALLNPEYTHTGIGVVTGSWIWAQHFGGIILPNQERIETQ